MAEKGIGKVRTKFRERESFSLSAYLQRRGPSVANSAYSYLTKIVLEALYPA
jgi:hypothetical protein